MTTELSLAGKTLFITGASRGIGLEIGKRAARDGANVVIAAKTTEPNPKLPGTIYTAAEEINAVGGQGLAVVCDIRDEAQIEAAVAKAVEVFGGIDICVNNASAIQLTPTEMTTSKRYDLMHSINGRGTWLVTQKCLKHLKQAENPHVLNISPPLDMSAENMAKWFGQYSAYSLAKMSMSIYAASMAIEFRKKGIAFNTLWPRTVIGTSAIANMPGGQKAIAKTRKPTIMGEAAWHILTKDAAVFSGYHCMDDIVLAEAGITDLREFRTDPDNGELMPDLFLVDGLPEPDGIIS